jgi:transposase-like protein
MFELTTDAADDPVSEIRQSLDELAREGARRMLCEALRLEADEYVEQLRGERDAEGYALVVRNGKGRERKVTLGSGTVAIRAPRVNDRRAEERFSSKILPPYLRRSPGVAEALPALYLRGLSTGDFTEGLAALVGPEGAALSATTITRLLKVWQKEYDTWRERPLAGADYVYIWADGLHFNVRLEEDRLACLVIMGVRLDGKKEVIALEEGYRESTESWASLLRDLKRRGVPAPVLAIGDGALGFWGALRQVYPETREQRCWVHKIANVLDKLPKRFQAHAKEMLHKIMQAPDRGEAQKEMKSFVTEFEAKYPKAADCLTKDAEALFTFFDFPAEHWRHLRTTNPIESLFAGVRARTRKTKGAGSRKAGLAMAFKLALAGEGHWQKVHAAQLVALVRAGVRFQDGVLVAARNDSEQQVQELHEEIAA